MENRATALAVLVMRVWMGLNFVFSHGLSKISDPEAFLGYSSVQKFPAPEVSGWFAILAEFVGGILLTVGLGTRVVSLALFGTMLGAGLVVHWADPWMKKEFALTYAVIALFFVAYGGGRYSLDRWIRRRREG
jgi:putative oxidoreductase